MKAKADQKNKRKQPSAEPMKFFLPNSLEIILISWLPQRGSKLQIMKSCT